MPWGHYFLLRDDEKNPKIYPVLVVNLVPVLPATVYFTGGKVLPASSFYQSQYSPMFKIRGQHLFRPLKNGLNFFMLWEESLLDSF